jgi:ferric-dicitrate binding protein FerR (iron transport regulator)
MTPDTSRDAAVQRPVIAEDFADSPLPEPAEQALWAALDPLGETGTRLDPAESFARGIEPYLAEPRGATERLRHAASIRHPRSGPAIIQRYGRVTAVVGALIVLGIAMPAVVQRGTKEKGPDTVYTTTAGQSTRITLADGSRITLAPHTRLTVAREFGRSNRTVAVVGQAYFEVATATGAPFIVRTGNITTQVLGTSFDIRRYATDQALQIAVVSGRVMTTNRHEAVTLAAGVFADIGDSVVMSRAVSDIKTYTTWTTGRLIFEDTPASMVLAAVGRWYGYDFRIADSALANRRLFAALRIATLETLLDATMTFDGTVVTIRPRRAERSIAPRHEMKNKFPIPQEAGK